MSEACNFEDKDNSRRSLGVSPVPLASRLLLAKTSPRSTKIGDQITLTPTRSRSPSSNSSCTTLKHPPVIFPCELSDRIFFIVTPSSNLQAPGIIMGLAEAQYAETFRTGVHERLESRGEQVRRRKIVAHIPVSYVHRPSVPKTYHYSNYKTLCRDTTISPPVL